MAAIIRINIMASLTRTTITTLATIMAVVTIPTAIAMLIEASTMITATPIVIRELIPLLILTMT